MYFDKIELPSNKRFGLFFSFIFFLISIYLLIYGSKFLFFVFLAIFLLFFIISIFSPEILNQLNRAWMMLGLIIGKIVSPIVIGVIFFFVICPVGLCIRLSKRDELRLKKFNRKSLWEKRDQRKFLPCFFKRQY